MGNISENLRAALLLAIETTPLREIARQTAIDVGQLSRFARDLPGGNLGAGSLDTLAEYLGLELRAVPKSRRGK